MPSISYTQARELVDNAVAIATEKQVSISVAVCDAHGELMAFARMDDASLHSGVLAQTKAYTSARDRQPSGQLGAWARSTGKDISYWNDPKITGFMGGVPVLVNEQVAGGIGISGLSEEDDEALAYQAIGQA